MQGLELSLCGDQLFMHTTNGEAQQLFNHYRVHADSFASGGRDIMAAPVRGAELGVSRGWLCEG